MPEEMKRIEIGFGGGQVMTTRLSADQLEALRRALGSAEDAARDGGTWYELESEDGAISLDLRQVVFVRIAAAPHTIGFSNP